MRFWLLKVANTFILSWTTLEKPAACHVPVLQKQKLKMPLDTVFKLHFHFYPYQHLLPHNPQKWMTIPTCEAVPWSNRGSAYCMTKRFWNWNHFQKGLERNIYKVLKVANWCPHKSSWIILASPRTQLANYYDVPEEFNQVIDVTVTMNIIGNYNKM